MCGWCSVQGTSLGRHHAGMSGVACSESPQLWCCRSCAQCPRVHLQVDIGHDGQDERDRWHLEWVRVTNLTTGETATFNCNRWGLNHLQRIHKNRYRTGQALLQHEHPALPPCLAVIPGLAGAAV